MLQNTQWISTILHNFFKRPPHTPSLNIGLAIVGVEPIFSGAHWAQYYVRGCRAMFSECVSRLHLTSKFVSRSLAIRQPLGSHSVATR